MRVNSRCQEYISAEFGFISFAGTCTERHSENAPSNTLIDVEERSAS